MHPVGAIHESPAAQRKSVDSVYCVVLNEYGVILKSVIEQLPVKYPELKIDSYVIMPNHIHMIIDIHWKRAIRESPLQSRSLISKSMGYLKMNVSKRINTLNGRNIAIWQRSFYDHIIRSKQEYKKIWQYIEDNPTKWFKDKYYAE
jgi:putative transposase